MSELLEPFIMGTTHKVNDPKCPFCPKKKNDEHYTTYSGADNDADKLGRLINEPKKFGTSIEADARPKDGKVGKDQRANQGFKTTSGETLDDVKDGDTNWKFQPHHAIPGNQCLKGHAVEKFIVGGAKVKFDTGYSVNNPQNGIWLPSYPADGNWPTDPSAKYAMAVKAMKAFKRQFHLGHHNIDVDVDGLDPAVHKNYINYVKSILKDLNVVLSDWEAACPEQDKDDKHRGDVIIHNALDCVSAHLIKKLKGSPRTWKFFVSRHARDFTIKTIKPNTKLDFER